MTMTYLDTHSVEEVLFTSSDYNIYTFEKSFPEHQEAVNAVWTRRPEINVDNALVREAAGLIQTIRYRRKLKRLTCQRRRQGNSFSKLPAAIASNCSQLEVLNITGLKLSPDDVSLLSSCTSLKRLNIKYDADATEFVEQLVANNSRLEGIRLECVSFEGCITNNLFKKLPNTIKELEIINDYCRLENYNTFWERLHIWRLEKLEINVKLKEKHILRLSRLTTLKHLKICFGAVSNSLEILFRNNPNLQEVVLSSYNAINGTCLKYLPPTLKSLKFEWNGCTLDDDSFVECVRTWNLQTLSMCFNNNINLITRILNAAPSLIDINIAIVDTLPDPIYKNVEIFSQLKVLHLAYISFYENNPLKCLLKNCVNLQKLKLNMLVFDHKIFSVVAALPNLKEFCLDCELYEDPDYVSCLRTLSRSTSITTIEFDYCFDFTEREILLIIRECRTFTKLILGLRDPLMITRIFTKEIVQELEKQKERETMLTIEIKCLSIYDKKIRKKNLHPMLNLEFPPLSYW